MAQTVGQSVDDPLAVDQRLIGALGLPTAWERSTGDGVTIAVVDSGLDGDHPDLVDQVAPDTPDEGRTDRLGTGTHAAGVAAATRDNGVGIAGVAPDALVAPIPVLDDTGATDPATVAAAITTAAGARSGVIALTLGGDRRLLADVLDDDGVRRALRAADEAGSVVVAGDPVSPATDDLAALPVLLVSPADDPAGTVGGVTVPADDVLGTAPLGPSTAWRAGSDGYEVRSGTGPATAAVAGVAALLVSLGRTPQEVRDLLVGTSGPDGTVDAATAVEQAATGAGGQPVVGLPDEDGGALPPAAVGAVALTAALGAIALVIWSGRGPRPDDRPHGDADRR